MTTPLPFQREDVDQVAEWRYRALIASEMGLGKTFMSLLALVESKARRAIIVCPAPLKLHWKRQAREHFRLRSHILRSRTPHNTHELKHKKLLIINYDILPDWLPYLRSYKTDMVITDECHLVGNLHAQRTVAWRKLCRGVKHVLCLSGTPLVNRPWELFPSLNIINPEEFDSPFTYGMRYCEGQKSWGRWKFQGARNLPELHQKLISSCMVRRTKAEVLKDLPPITRTVVPLELPPKSMKEYQEAEDDLISWLAKTDMVAARKAMWAEGLSKWTHMRKLIITLKLPLLFQWLDSFLQESDGKMLFGCHHKIAMKALHERYRDISVVIDGSKTEKQRDEAEQAFRKVPKIRILFGQHKAAGQGLNLQVASNVAFGELPWSPGACQQFEARCHRLGSQGNTQVSYLVAHRTLEMKLCSMLQKKMKILDQVLDGVNVQESSLTLFQLLTESLNHVPK